MKILAMDQARKGAWSVFSYDTKELLDSGVYNYEYILAEGKRKKIDYMESVVLVEQLLNDLIAKFEPAMVILEDVPVMRTFATKQLLRLQGTLMATLTRKKIPYELVTPLKWQSVYKYKISELTPAQKRYKKKLETTAPYKNMKSTKRNSLLAVKKIFRKELDNDDLADAILIGWYAVNNLYIKEGK